MGHSSTVGRFVIGGRFDRVAVPSELRAFFAIMEQSSTEGGRFERVEMPLERGTSFDDDEMPSGHEETSLTGNKTTSSTDGGGVL